jgi:3-hydroxyacyl-CoA dehydrogenase
MHEYSVGIVGASEMGCGLAALAAANLRSITLVDAAALRARQCVDKARLRLERAARDGWIREDDARAAMARIEPSAALADLQGCGVVLEAVEEDPELKQSLLARLEQILAPSAVLAATSPRFAVRELLLRPRNPERVLGLHLPFPLLSNPIAEVVLPEAADHEAAERLKRFARILGKAPITTADRPPLVVTRLLLAAAYAALSLLEHREASIATIDVSARLELGAPSGPFVVMNRIGLERLAPMAQRLKEERGLPIPASLEQQRAAGIPWPEGGVPAEEDMQRCQRVIGDAVRSAMDEMVDEGTVSRADVERAAILGLSWRSMGDPAGPADVETWIHRNVAVLTVHAAERAARLEAGVAPALTAALDRSLADPSVGAVIVCGTGATWMAGKLDGESRRLIASVMGSAKPVIAAVQGSVRGGGTEFALSCQGRVLCTDAVLQLEEESDNSEPRSLLATEALAAGIADDVAGPDRLLSRAFRLAQQLRSN